VLAPHPNDAYLKKREGSNWLAIELKDRIKAVRTVLDKPGRFGYVNSQDYGDIRTDTALDAVLDVLYAEAKAGRYVSVDIEDGEVKGKPHTPLMIGFGWGRYEDKQWKGGARSVLLEHPEYRNPYLRSFKEKLGALLADQKAKKTLQHGSYDVPPCEEYFKIKFAGYTFDTQYASYLFDSNLRKYSFENLIKKWLLEFGDYKTELVKDWKENFAEAPLSKLVPYNCADCDVTMRLTEKTRKRISLPLLYVYILDAMVFDKMEERGPYLDRIGLRELQKEIPQILDPILQRLRVLANNSDFNLNTPKEVAALLYDELKLPEMNGRSTDAQDLELLFKETNHPAPRLIMHGRSLGVIMRTFFEGYLRSADANRELLLTRWKLTGAATGRLRSGDNDDLDGEGKGVVMKGGRINLQNTHGHPLMQNLLVSDPNWRLAL
jgi:DNA polymerase I-like protein with 3'-5' exonuclease and polymerase domains